MPIQEEQLKKLQDILKLVNEGITKREFLEAFKNVLNIVLKAENTLAQKNNKAIAEMNRLFGELENKVKTSANSDVSKAIKELRDLIDKALKDQEVGMNSLQNKLLSLKDGRDADEKKIIDNVIKKLPKVKEFDVDTAEKIRDKLEKLRGNERIDWKSIRGLEEALKDARVGTGMFVFGGNRPLQIKENGTVKEKAARFLNFTGATLTRAANGELTIAVAGGTPVSNEVPTDSGDHLNFTLAHTPSTSTFRLFRGGARQQAIVDYTLTVAALVITPALATNEVLICDYNY